MKPLTVSFAFAVLAPIASAQEASLGDVSGMLDFRIGGADGESSWLDGDFGKLGLGGDDRDFKLDARLARGVLVWRPSLSWSTDLYLQLEVDPEQDDVIGVGEAYLRFKPLPSGPVRYSVRVGAFYPPVSLEHDGLAWSTTHTITPSAINSWIGEEVKVGAVEGTVTAPLADGQLSVTGALFGYNDTSGTLLTFRGWAMHDHQVPIGGSFPLPERTPQYWSFRKRQAHKAEPFREIDDRVGYYARAEWRAADPFLVNFTYYNNAGDGRSYEDLQTSWATTFSNVGFTAALSDDFHLFAQAMIGKTDWIPLANAPIPYVDDVGFRAVYVMLDRAFGDQGVALRLDAFDTADRDQAFSYNSTPETGWSVTAAWRNQLAPGLLLMVEGLFIDSDRPSRTADGIAARQSQLQIESGLRWEF